MLHFSEACERNKGPILEILKDVLRDCSTVLEIGSGTAQHAVYFGDSLPHLEWQPSDVRENIPIILDNLRKHHPANVKQPLEIDVRDHPWPVNQVDAIYSANTLHIMSWDMVRDLFKGIGNLLRERGTLCIYGPFRYNDSYTSNSNADFDNHLRMRDPQSGIRDFEAVNDLAQQQGLKLQADIAMPANNQLLIWRQNTWQ